MDAERSNERSARTLLALVHLAPDDPWSKAANPMLGTRAIMDWIRDEYGLDYKPNTRETVRRQTLHQFAEAHLVVQNPDEPDRPVNSPKWNYQVPIEALAVIRLFGSAKFDAALEEYRAIVPGLKAQYAAARELNRIPITLPDGKTFTLSPGGQNVLIRQIVDDFCGYFTPGAQVLYIGDADTKWAMFEVGPLAACGVTVDSHGKMPDLVVYLPDKNWLVLIEAASSHGPVDAKRHAELAALFEKSTAGLVYVSAFPDRKEMRKYLAVIAWETDVWCAEDPTHLIHFNGERFLGPYE
jgi:type II restriction enzyme